MKTLLILHIVFSLLAIIKIRLIGYKVNREYLIVKKHKGIVERVLEILYSITMMFIPPINLFLVFTTDEYLIKRLTEGLVKKDA